jgi:hypothetical protein
VFLKHEFLNRPENNENNGTKKLGLDVNIANTNVK